MRLRKPFLKLEQASGVVPRAVRLFALTLEPKALVLTVALSHDRWLLQQSVTRTASPRALVVLAVAVPDPLLSKL